MSDEKLEAKVEEKLEDIIDVEDSSKSLLDKVVDYGEMTSDEDQKQFAVDIITNFADEVTSENIKIKKDIYRAINERITQIDKTLTEQINEILHNKEFQKLESSWRHVYDFVRSSEPDNMVKIRLLDVKKIDLLADFDAAADFDQSGLFNLVYEKEYGTYGGAPYGLLIGDYSMSRSVRDIELLRGISQVASSAHAPFISSTDPSLFNLSSFTDLNKPKSLESTFSSAEYGAWRSFRKTEEAKYVALTLPRVIQRLPYGGANGLPVDSFDFTEEIVQDSDGSNYLWGNPAYKLAERMVESFRNAGWFSSIRGAENGGVVENLPVHTFKDENGDSTFKLPVETIITDRREKELDDLGFISLVYKKGTDSATFFGSKVSHLPDEYEDPVSNANAKLNCELPYLMAVSRFAHYLKVMMRDKLGSFMSKSGTQEYLNNWISRYVMNTDNPTNYAAARFPLKEARVDVTEKPGSPGVYNAVLYLKPHIYFNEISISIRLVSELPAGGG